MSIERLTNRLFQLKRLEEQGKKVKQAQNEAWELIKKRIEQKADLERRPK